MWIAIGMPPPPASIMGHVASAAVRNGRARWVVVAAVVAAGAAIAGGLIVRDHHSTKTAARSGLATTGTTVPVPGLPDGLGGLWTLTAFTDGTGPLRAITWDPRQLASISFVSGLPTDAGPTVEVAFSEDGCNTSWLRITQRDAAITVDPTSYRSTATTAGTSACPPGMLWSPPPVRRLLVGPPPGLHYAIRDKVLSVENPTTGASLQAMREDDIRAPLPPGLKTPKDLYGRWTPRSWTDGTGSHDVSAPADRDITMSFQELGLGPFISYVADCNGTTIANVTYTDGAIAFDPSAQTSTTMGCLNAWQLPALRTLFGPDGHLRYQVVGNTLTVLNVSARITLIATRS